MSKKTGWLGFKICRKKRWFFHKSFDSSYFKFGKMKISIKAISTARLLYAKFFNNAELQPISQILLILRILMKKNSDIYNANYISY